MANHPSREPALSRRGVFPRRIWIAIIVLLIVAGGTLLVGVLSHINHGQNTSAHSAFTVNASNANGAIQFADSQQSSTVQSNRAIILVNGLPSLPTTYQYDAWLVNSQHKQALRLGALTLQAQSYTLDVTTNINLLSAGDTVEITLERSSVATPTGNILLSANFPAQAFQHIRHLLVSFPTTPGNVGLLVGLRAQAQQLLAIAQSLAKLASAQNASGVACAAQAIINISEGQRGAHNHPLSKNCSPYNLPGGDGFGLLGNGYIATAQAHITLASIAPDATIDIRVHSRHVGIALADIQQWTTTIDTDAQSLLKHGASSAIVAQLSKLANQNLNGIDINGDGTVDYVPGEAGATIAYTHTQLMATLLLAPAQ